MKKLICGLLSGVMLFGSASMALADKEKFTDFSKSDYAWAYDYVMDMVDAGYITGYEDKTFKPDNGVTRLEVMALFSRVLGALKSENAEVLDMAVKKYAEILKPYKLPWGQKEISFLLYRGVLTEADLNTYLDGDLKNEPMPRYEAAIIITKAMNGKPSQSVQGSDLGFTDYRKIPNAAVRYVKYVSDQGIMTGMEDGNFSPDTSVLRTQMAAMMSRVVDKTNYTFLAGKIGTIDSVGRYITLYDENDEEQKFYYVDSVLMKVEGAETIPQNMIVGVDAVLTLTDGKVVFVDTVTSVPDEIIKGTYQSRSSSGDTVKIVITNDETGKKETYSCSSTVSVMYDGQPSALTNFNTNDRIKVYLEEGLVDRIEGESKTVKINGAEVMEISLDPDFTMTIAHAKEEYNGSVFPIGDTVTVIKNNDRAEFSEILVGDKVNLTLTYGKITGIDATSTTKTTAGSIKAITISATPEIVVNIGGQEVTYPVSSAAEITVNGKAGSLYDFRVGDSVTLTVESQTVVKIVTTTAQSVSGKIEGTVSAVNAQYGFIRVTYINDLGISVDETVYCKDTSTKIMDTAGATKRLKDIQVGSGVSAHGTSNNGAFTASIIVISAE